MVNKKTYKDIVKEVQQIQYDDPLTTYDEDVLSERDFYPPSDDRVWTTYIQDIEGGDSFAEYCKYFFELCDEEEYFD